MTHIATALATHMMKDLTRREFVKHNGILVLGFGNTLMLGVIAYIAFIVFRGFLNVTVSGWLALGSIALIFLFFYLIALLANRIVEKCRSKFGLRAEANIYALSITFEAILLGLFIGMAVKAFYTDRADNIMMYSILSVISLYRLFKESRLRVLTG